MRALPLLAAAVLGFASPSMEACIVIGDHPAQPVISRNFDYPIGGEDGYGMLLHNPKGFLRQAIRVNTEDNPAAWRSKYSSITLNLLSPGTPQDGMNDSGLIGTMTVIYSRIHKTIPDATLPSVNEMEFLQFILDQAATTDDVVRLLVEHPGQIPEKGVISDAKPKVRLTKISKLKGRTGEDNFHWIFCDRSGKSVLVDYIDTHFQLTLIPAAELIVSNDDTDVLDMQYSRVPSDALPLPQEAVSRATSIRFFNAKHFKDNPNALHDEAISNHELKFADNIFIDPETRELLRDKFHHLKRSTNTEWNKWQVVYLPQEDTFYFRTKGARKIKKVPVGKLLARLESSKTTTGISAHTGDVGVFTADLFQTVDPAPTVRDVMTLMGQSPDLVQYVAQHFLRHEDLNRHSPSMEEFQEVMRNHNREPLIAHANGTPSRLSRLTAYTRLLAHKWYRQFKGLDR